MNDYLNSVLLGIIEGLTEFLPVSSTAHLRISQELLGIDLKDSFWKMYAIVIQIGAVLCLPIYFWGRIVKFLATFPRGERGDRNALTHPLSLTLIAFVCTAGPSLLLAGPIKKHLENLYGIGAALLLGGIVMWVVDRFFGQEQGNPGSPPAVPASDTPPEVQFRRQYSPEGVAPVPAVPAETAPPPGPESLLRGRTERMDQMTLFQAVWIGLCQILSAVFPGTSRSMSTIAAGQVAGMTRTAALEFSFFLSMPTMAAAVGYEFYKTVLRHKGEQGETLETVRMDAQRWVVLAIGLVVSFLVALGVVHWFMGWVRKHGFTPFAVYRIVLGAAVLAWAATH